jgi:hypothetical protein
MLHRFGHVSRLFGVESSGLTFPDGAETAVTRTDVAGEHERRGPV